MFLNVLMLTGVGAAVIPLVLHLLSRSRYRNVDWGAMMFLQGADVRQRQSTRLSQWLLMAVRMALVALLAVALARPVVRGAWAGGAGAAEQRLTAVLVLDASASMGYDENGRTRMELARGAALQVLAALRPGDRAALVTMGRPQSDDETRPTADLREIANRLQAVQPGTGTADLPDGLEHALNVFDLHEPGPRDIYVIADRQERTWRSADEKFQAGWRDRLARAGLPPPRLFAVPVGSTAADNVSVEGVELPNGPAVRGQEAEVEVHLRNRGGARRAALPLTLALNGNPVAEAKVDLAPDAPALVRLSVTFPAAGSQVLTASVKTAGLTADDRYDAAVDVVEPIRVLVLSGDERPGSFRGESDFLRLALAPYKTTGAKPAGGANDPAEVTVRPADPWPEVELNQFQVVVLANVERFGEQQVRALEQYVYGGGGLLVAPGSLSRPDAYNDLLYRGGAGILPGELFPPTPADGSGATTLVGYEPNHPIFRFLRGRPDPFPSATVGRYFPAGVRQASGVALAYFLSGDPFLVESAAATVGRGRVLLMTTPLDADWSTLPLSNFYLPFMQSVVRYLAGGTVDDRNLKPGDPIRVVFDEPAAEDDNNRTSTLTRPDRPQPIPLPVLPYGNGELRYADTFAPGEYRVTVKDGPNDPTSRTIHFVVHPPQEESDLTPMTESQWRWVEQGLGMKRLDADVQPIAAVISGGRDGRELWAGLIGAVLLLGVAEVALSARWAREEA